YIVGLGVIGNLRIVNAEPAAHDRLAVFPRIENKTNPGREIQVIIGKRLPLVAQAKIQSEVGAQAEVVLDEQGPERVIHRVAPRPKALCVALDVAYVAYIRGAFAER